MMQHLDETCPQRIISCLVVGVGGVDFLRSTHTNHHAEVRQGSKHWLGDSRVGKH